MATALRKIDSTNEPTAANPPASNDDPIFAAIARLTEAHRRIDGWLKANPHLTTVPAHPEEKRLGDLCMQAERGLAKTKPTSLRGVFELARFMRANVVDEDHGPIHDDETALEHIFANIASWAQAELRTQERRHKRVVESLRRVAAHVTQSDPALAVIERHRQAVSDFYSYIEEDGRDRDPAGRRHNELNAALDNAHDELFSVTPVTTEGLLALIGYLRDLHKEGTPAAETLPVDEQLQAIRVAVTAVWLAQAGHSGFKAIASSLEGTAVDAPRS